MNQQIEDLRERMKVLQNDRKANVEVLEANKTSNKDEIRKLRDENKDLRQKLALLQKTALQDEGKDEIGHISKEVDRLRKVCDELKLKSSRYRKSLEDLRDEVRDLELDSQRPHMEDNEYTRRIRALENKLDKAMIKYNEAQSIRKTYEQIVRRLKEERVGFDNQLAAIERTLSAKQRDYEELLLLAGDANQAREGALGELDRIRAGYDEERKRRERGLRERHQMVQLRRQMLERIKQREMMRKSLAGDGDMGGSNGQQYLLSTDNNGSPFNGQSSQQALNTEKIAARNRIDIFENAFRKIKEATGVSDVNEVIQKIISQESTTENLINLTRENQGKIEGLAELRRKLKQKVEEVKYSGAGGAHRRKMIDDHEDQLANSVTRFDRSKLKYDRLSKILISMKAGVGHMQDKLDPVREELGGRLLDLSDETVVDVLKECELVISNLQRRIKAVEDERKRLRMTGGLSTDSVTSISSSIADELNIGSSRPFNQRIDLSLDDDYEFGAVDIGDGDAPDMDDEELTRDKVKRASNSILMAIDRKKRKPKKKGGVGGAEEEKD